MSQDRTLILAAGAPAPDPFAYSDSDAPADKTVRLALMQHTRGADDAETEVLAVLHTWAVPAASASGVALHAVPSGDVSLSYITPSGALRRQVLRLPSSSTDTAPSSAPPSARTSLDAPSPTTTLGSSAGGSRLHLPLQVPRHLRALAARSVERLPLLGGGAKDGAKEGAGDAGEKGAGVLGEDVEVGAVRGGQDGEQDGEVLEAALDASAGVVRGALRRAGGVVVSVGWPPFRRARLTG
jgi:hypothetical protein